MIQQLGDGWQPAHQEQRCLVCHATLEPVGGNISLAQQESLQDGVSCEACHGAAEKWLGPHTEHTWRTGKSAADRAGLGFIDLRLDLTQRAQTCAKCHVGGPGRDVNHDLIAAGHPRLNFELAAYHANLPAHWSVSEDQKAFPVADNPNGSALEARLWLIGQLTSADAALDLLENRAAQSNHDARPTPWPEFAEYGCFACHHELQSPSWRQQSPVAGRKPGSYPWGTWYFSLTTLTDRTDGVSSLSEVLSRLDQTMGQPRPATTEVITNAMTARALIAAELRKHSAPNALTTVKVRELLGRMTQEGQRLSGRDWDAAAQVYLGTVSLLQAKLQAAGQLERLQTPTETDRELLQLLESLREKLKFPQNDPGIKFSSPRTFDGERIRLIGKQLERIDELVKQP